MLFYNPDHRPSAESALTRPWMQLAAMQRQVSAPSFSVDVLRRVAEFTNESAIQRAVAAIAVYSQIGMKQSDVDEMERQFHHIDLNGDGIISRSELSQVLQKQLEMDKQAALGVFDRLDVDGDQEISRSEFLAAAVEDILSESTVRAVFARFDLNADGKIQLGELIAIIGDSFCGQSTKEIFSSLDANDDREIDFEEFAAILGELPKTSMKATSSMLSRSLSALLHLSTLNAEANVTAGR